MLIGIDVAKAELVIASRPSGERWTVANEEAGIRAPVEREPQYFGIVKGGPRAEERSEELGTSDHGHRSPLSCPANGRA